MIDDDQNWYAYKQRAVPSREKLSALELSVPLQQLMNETHGTIGGIKSARSKNFCNTMWFPPNCPFLYNPNSGHKDDVQLIRDLKAAGKLFYELPGDTLYVDHDCKSNKGDKVMRFNHIEDEVITALTGSEPLRISDLLNKCSASKGGLYEVLKRLEIKGKIKSYRKMEIQGGPAFYSLKTDATLIDVDVPLAVDELENIDKQIDIHLKRARLLKEMRPIALKLNKFRQQLQQLR